MPRVVPLVFSLSLLLGGCGEPPEAPAGVHTEVNTAYGAACPAYAVDMGVTVPSGSCMVSSAFTTPGGVAGTEYQVRADCTDPSGGITGNLDKRHVVMIPNSGAAGLPLWVHLSGTGGQPTGSENIGEAAIDAGYRYISLAYMNNQSTADRCTCPSGERRAGNCNEEVRLEILYGDGYSADFVMDSDESIENRLEQLLRALDHYNPADGWDSFKTSGGDVDWSQISMSGFSQGGGMTGLIARDHELERVMYLSKGAGLTVNIVADPTVAVTCSTTADCSGDQVCCALEDFDGSCTPSPTATNYCLEAVVAPWAYTGADTDGDGLGNGDATTRATPASASYALVHEGELAWNYSPEVFDTWGMGTISDFVDADPGGPFASGDQLFSTTLAPNGSCGEHQSIGNDFCQPKTGGVPDMYDVWLHAMTAP